MAPPRRNIAKIPLYLGDITQLLQLPEGVYPVHVYATNDPPLIWVIVQSDELPAVEDGAEAPIIQSRSQVVEVDGRHYLQPVPATTAKEFADRAWKWS